MADTIDMWQVTCPVFFTTASFSLLLGSASPTLAQTKTSAPAVHVGAQSSATPIRDAVSRHAVELASTTGATTSIASSSSDHSWPRRHPVLLGALAGFSGGLIYTAANDCSRSSDYTCTSLGLFFGGIGAGIGAGVGGIAALFLR